MMRGKGRECVIGNAKEGEGERCKLLHCKGRSDRECREEGRKEDLACSTVKSSMLLHLHITLLRAKCVSCVPIRTRIAHEDTAATYHLAPIMN